MVQDDPGPGVHQDDLAGLIGDHHPVDHGTKHRCQAVALFLYRPGGFQNAPLQFLVHLPKLLGHQVELVRELFHLVARVDLDPVVQVDAGDDLRAAPYFGYGAHVLVRQPPRCSGDHHDEHDQEQGRLEADRVQVLEHLGTRLHHGDIPVAGGGWAGYLHRLDAGVISLAVIFKGDPASVAVRHGGERDLGASGQTAPLGAKEHKGTQLPLERHLLVLLGEQSGDLGQPGRVGLPVPVQLGPQVLRQLSRFLREPSPLDLFHVVADHEEQGRQRS